MRRIFEKIKMCVNNVLLCVQAMFWKRQNDIVLFGAWFGEKFADNSRYLFQYLSENKEKLKLSHVVWVTRSQKVCDELRSLGYESYMLESDESIYFHKKAGMHIICNSASGKGGRNADIRTELSYGAVRVNLWHGVGVVKGVGCGSLEYQRKKEKHKLLYTVKEFAEKFKWYRLYVLEKGGWGDFYFLSPTEAATKQFKRFAYIPHKKFIHTLYPRTCQLVKPTEKEKLVLDKIKEYKKIIMYLPTFRTGSNQFDYTTLAGTVKDILEKENVLWIQKAHSASKICSLERESNNILNLEPEFDINVVMPHISLLITDYSSAASDARYFHKPVLFYVPDFEEYMRGDNGVTEEAEELLSGPKFYNLMELSAGLEKYINDVESAKPDDYDKIRFKYWGEEKVMEQIWEDIIRTTKYTVS